MVFDKLCGVIERHYPKLKHLLDDAKIFQFEGIPHEILPTLFEGKTDSDIDDMCKGFFLPYQTVVIEDGASCILLHDTLPDTIGLDHDRLFIEAAYPFTDGKYYETKFFDTDQRKMLAQNDDIRPLTVSFGEHKISEWNRQSFGATGRIIKASVLTKHKVYFDDIMKEYPKADEKNVMEGILINVGAALQEIMFFNQPDKFILERRHIKHKKTSKTKIARSHQRPVYTILHPAEIRKRMNIHHSTKAPLIEGHDRRRHVRYLSNPIYAKDPDGYMIEPKTIPDGPRRGELYFKKTIIPATWVGPSESTIGNKRYKVILDR